MMTTLIKAKLKKSDNETNTDKYRVAANITEYYILSKVILEVLESVMCDVIKHV